MNERLHSHKRPNRVQRAITELRDNNGTPAHEIYEAWRSERIERDARQASANTQDYPGSRKIKEQMRKLQHEYREAVDFTNALQAVAYEGALERVTPIACDNSASWSDLSDHIKEQEGGIFHLEAEQYLADHPPEIVDFIATVGGFTHLAYDETVRTMMEEDPNLYSFCESLDDKEYRAHGMIRDLADMHFSEDNEARELKEALDIQFANNEITFPEYCQLTAETLGLSSRLFLSDPRAEGHQKAAIMVNVRMSRISNARTVCENTLLSSAVDQWYGYPTAAIYQHLLSSPLTDRTHLRLAAAPAFYFNGEKGKGKQQRSFSNFTTNVFPQAIKRAQLNPEGCYIPAKDEKITQGGRCPIQHTTLNPSYEGIRNALAQQYECDWSPPSVSVDGEVRIADTAVAISLLLGGRKGGLFDMGHNGGPLGIIERYNSEHNLPTIDSLVKA